MILPKLFVEQLQSGGIEFYAGVPDSLLKNLCAYLTDCIPGDNHIIAANEGGAVGLAIGYHLATGKISCVYMQNSGEGNIVNPMLSLVDKDVYHIPMLLIIGWRGEPGVHDEPQHVKQGKVTLDLLNVIGCPYLVLDSNWQEQIDCALKFITETGTPYALIIRKGIFDDYIPLKTENTSDIWPMSREEAIMAVIDHIHEDDLVVGTTGMISRELFEYRESLRQGHEHDFLTVGGMGHANQIALGIALHKQDKRVFVFDGDGALLMHTGSLAIIGNKQPNNLVHLIFNNGAHDSVGGQPTVGQQIDVVELAKAMGYKYASSVNTKEELITSLEHLNLWVDGTVLINVNVHKGNRKDLGRPTTTPIQNKEAFMKLLKS